VKALLPGLLVLLSFHGEAAMADPHADEDLWDKVYAARQAYFEASFGKLPDDILKLGRMTGVWPGGGLFVIPATRLGKGLWVYTTFGFTNPDMPTEVTVADVKLDSDGKRLTRTEATLKKKEYIRPRSNRPGYGYEILIVARENARWPLGFLQWAANAEILNDADLLSRVEKHAGLTVEDIKVGDRAAINVLIAKAQPPLPADTMLPNGKMELLVATVITEDEMRWSIKNGRAALLAKLQKSGIGQVSVLNRASVLK
jgi:suppressor of fused protein SUFU